MSWKSIFLTTLLSAVVFIVLVSMGMKYHWINLIKNKSEHQVELVIPEQAINYLNDPQIIQASESGQKSGFQAVVLENSNMGSAFASMTKRQVIDFCKKESLEMDSSKKQHTALSIGDCVLSNYQETYQEINLKKGSGLQFANMQHGTGSVSQPIAMKSPGKNRQAQTRYSGQREFIHKKCAYAINKQTLLSAYEKQLLIQTCIADGP